MALNISTFKTRAATAGVFVAVMLAGIFWNYWSFFILFSIIHFGCWAEYQKLVRLIDNKYAAINSFHQYGVMIAGWCVMLYFTSNAYAIFGIPLHTVGWWLRWMSILIWFISELLLYRQWKLKNMAWSVFGCLYISLPLALMINLRNPEFSIYSIAKESYFRADRGWTIPIIIIFSIWVNDTMAYLVGSFIGRTPFSKISPKKTWEGTAGGIILCVAAITCLLQFLLFWKFLLMISLIAAITAVAGDLFESKLKRMAGIKDSGSIMPGHGGFLDRFDSLLIATPFVWLYTTFFMK